MSDELCLTPLPPTVLTALLDGDLPCVVLELPAYFLDAELLGVWRFTPGPPRSGRRMTGKPSALSISAGFHEVQREAVS